MADPPSLGVQGREHPSTPAESTEDREGNPMRLNRPHANLAGTSRMEALSDATFAIVITLLVLEIHRPSGPAGHLARELIVEWPSYLGYTVAFINVGVIWLNHHYVFSQLAHTDLTLNWINLAILGTAALIPFPTGVLAAAFGAADLADQKTAVVLYALVAFAMSASWIPLFVHLRRNPVMLKDAVAPDYFAIEVIRPVAGAAGYVLAALLGWFVQPIIAAAICILIVAYYASTSTGVRPRSGHCCVEAEADWQTPGVIGQSSIS
jgi:uncharacterized membrane protein